MGGISDFWKRASPGGSTEEHLHGSEEISGRLSKIAITRPPSVSLSNEQKGPKKGRKFLQDKSYRAGAFR